MLLADHVVDPFAEVVVRVLAGHLTYVTIQVLLEARQQDVPET